MAAVSIHSFTRRQTHASLIGSFDDQNAAFLAEHLGELEGDVLLDCDRLESLDVRAARVLLRFRAAMRRHGRQVMLRSVPSTCRSILMRQAHACA
jgi:anti-anti-sigma regulatory factor